MDLFSTIQRLYSVTLTEIDEECYHTDVRVIEIKDKKGSIGRIYLDVYARENKRGGAWMSDFQGPYNDSLPVAFCGLQSKFS